MYARSTTIQAQASSIDDGIAYVRDEVMPALQAMDGYIGLSMLVDRATGRCITTSAWETEEALNTSTEQAAPLRERASEIFGGDASVQKWEVAVMHRDHSSADGACVRATWVQLPADQLDQGIEFYKSRVLPDVEVLEGFCSASLLVDRSSGRSVSSVTFDSRDAMERNRQQATELKNARIRDVGAEELDEGEFELALAHLRVPEMA